MLSEICRKTAMIEVVSVRLPAWLAGRVYLLERSPLRTRAHSLKGKVAECSRCLTNGAYFPFLLQRRVESHGTSRDGESCEDFSTKEDRLCTMHRYTHDMCVGMRGRRYAHRHASCSIGTYTYGRGKCMRSARDTKTQHAIAHQRID